MGIICSTFKLLLVVHYKLLRDLGSLVTNFRRLFTFVSIFNNILLPARIYVYFCVCIYVCIYVYVFVRVCVRVIMH